MNNPNRMLSPEDEELIAALCRMAKRRHTFTSEETKQFARDCRNLADRCPNDKEDIDAWFAEAEVIRERIKQEQPE